MLFGTLLFLSIKLRWSATRYRLVNRLLAFITLILIIEFVQTVAESYLETETTPVVDFFIRVSIAFAILPFEGLLRKTILSREDKKPEVTKSLKKLYHWK